MLQPDDVQHPAVGVHLGEGEAAGLRDAQAVAEGEQHQAAIAGFVAAAIRGLEQLVHFPAGQVLSIRA